MEGGEDIITFFLLHLDIPPLVTIYTTCVIKPTGWNRKSKPKCLPTESLYDKLILLLLVGVGGRGGASILYSRPRLLTRPVAAHVCPGRVCFDACVLVWVFLALEGRSEALGLTPSGHRRGDRNGTWGLLPGVSFVSLSLPPSRFFPSPCSLSLTVSFSPIEADPCVSSLGSGWWKRTVVAGSREVWEIEVFGGQGPVWNVLFGGGGWARVRRKSSSRGERGRGWAGFAGWVGRTPKKGSAGVGRCAGKGKMEAVRTGLGLARHSGNSFAWAVLSKQLTLMHGLFEWYFLCSHILFPDCFKFPLLWGNLFASVCLGVNRLWKVNFHLEAK